jgi:hypothetical protein
VEAILLFPIEWTRLAGFALGFQLGPGGVYLPETTERGQKGQSSFPEIKENFSHFWTSYFQYPY